MIWAVMWYWLLIIFTAADVITSVVCASRGFNEANPLMSPFFDNIIEMKIIALALAALGVIVYEKMYRGNGWFPLALGTCATFTAVLNNILLVF